MLDKIFKQKNLTLKESKIKSYMNDKEKSFYLLRKTMEKAQNSKVPFIDGVLEKVHLLFSMFKDWIKGEYTDIPKSALAAIILGLLYFASPIDFIPDFLVGLGFIDDAAVIVFVVKQISKDLKKYKKWKLNSENIIDIDPS